MSIDTVNDLPPRVQYIASASQTVFPYPFPIFQDADLVVEVEGSVRALDTDYTVSGEGDDTGGNVTFATGQTAGDVVTIYRQTVIERDSDFQQAGPMFSASVNDEFDKLIIIAQELRAANRRSLRLPISAEVADADIELSPISNWFGRSIVFNALTGKPEPGELVAGTITAAIIGGLLYPQTEEELAVLVTPSNTRYPPGDVRRYGAALDGSTDDTAALQRWLNVAGELTFPVAEIARVTAALTLSSNTTIRMVRGATIKLDASNVSLMIATSKTNIKIFGGTFTQINGGALANATLAFDACTFCEVRNAEIHDYQWTAIFLNNSNNCLIENNYVHDATSNAAGDKTDILIYRNSASNIISNNRCFGGLNGDVGIMVQDPGVGALSPRWNKVINNYVGDHRTYGIVFYMGDGTQQGDNLCAGNTIQNITGTGNAGNSGSGIYCQGDGLGAMVVSDNLVQNCCSLTTGTSNGPGGISIHDTTDSGRKVVISDNVVEAQVQGSGILISTIRGGATCSGNVVRLAAANDGTGPGGASLKGDAIRVVESLQVSVAGNVAVNAGTGDAFFCFASAQSCASIVVSGNVFRAQGSGGSGNAVRFDRSASNTHASVSVTGNQLRADGSGSLIYMNVVDTASVSGNVGGCDTGSAIVIAAVTAGRFLGNSFTSNHANGINASGACAGTFFDRSNQVTGAVANTSTGGLIYEKILEGSATYDPPGLADGIGATTTVTVTGAALGDFVEAVSFSLDVQGIIWFAWVSAADTVSIRLQNETGAAPDLASGTVRVRVIKRA